MPWPPELVRALIAPLAVGQPVGEGWSLGKALPERSGALFTLEGHKDEVMLYVEARDEGQKAFARTAHLNVLLQSHQPMFLPDSAARAVVTLVRALKRNDHLVAAPAGVQARSMAPAATAAPTLWLVPGHLGEPRDVSARGLAVLATAGAWLVEPGKASAAVELLAGLGVAHAGKEVVEIGDEPPAVLAARLSAIAARGQDACVFGAEEGIPGFADPGRALIEAAALARPAMRVRAVGGPSVLGMALMRVERPIHAFTFLGLAGPDDEAIFEELARIAQARRPLVLFASDGWIAENGVRLGTAARAVRASMSLLGDLTAPTEECVVWSPEVSVAPPSIAACRIVIVIFPPG